MLTFVCKKTTHRYMNCKFLVHFYENVQFTVQLECFYIVFYRLLILQYEKKHVKIDYNSRKELEARAYKYPSQIYTGI